ncbi:MAG TPA: hypothetical protein VN903_05100 [Polyangia bacterium]|jgi:hypothetical protein|nr:hypothetical protein [Polyangia bacterium]
MSVAVLSAIAAMLAAAGDAAPAPPPDGDGIAIDAVGGCPEVAAVRRLLANLVSPDEAHVAPISIQDRGTQYRVAVRASAMMIDDPARNCADRARHAAVFAANELHAPKIVLGPPEFTIEKGLIFEIASNNGGVVWAPGAEFRGAYGSKRWSLFGSAGARGPVTLMLDHDWRAELLRFPLDAGARVTGTYGRFRPWLTVGGSLTVTGIIGQELVQTEREWRVDVGALAMGGATLRITDRLGLSAALTVRWYPRRYQLQVVPAGTVGETPAWWFGIAGDYTLDGKGSTPP